MNKKTIHGICFLSMLGIIGLLAGCDDESEQAGEPDFTQPGGTEPDDGWFDAHEPIRIGLNANTDITEIVACGDSLNISSEMTAPRYDCQSSLGPLYDSALLDLQNQWGNVSCAEGCSKNPYINHQAGSCDETGATVEIFSTVECVGEGQAATTGLTPSDTSQPLPPFDETLPPVPDPPIFPPDDFAIDTTLPDPTFPGDEPRCPDGSVYIFNSKEVNSCENLHYAPWVTETRQKAQEVWNDFSCGSSCDKKPLLEAGLSWKCMERNIPGQPGGQAIVSLFGEIPCDQAQ